MTARRRLASPMDGTPSSAWKPSPSGPRWTIDAAIDARSLASTGRPSRWRTPAMPHISAHRGQADERAALARVEHERDHPGRVDGRDDGAHEQHGHEGAGDER